MALVGDVGQQHGQSRLARMSLEADPAVVDGVRDGRLACAGLDRPVEGVGDRRLHQPREHVPDDPAGQRPPGRRQETLGAVVDVREPPPVVDGEHRSVETIQDRRAVELAVGRH